MKIDNNIEIQKSTVKFYFKIERWNTERQKDRKTERQKDGNSKR